MTLTAERARAALAARLGERGLRHCVAVAETAERLADVYGVDRDHAYLAGLLHDWSREDGPEDLVESAQAAGIEVDGVDRAVPYLLHARVGAYRVRETFPDLPDAIVNAVERHTMATARMADLDMVVYLADLLEPEREFDGVDELRSAIGEVDLAELYARAYAASLRYLIERRKHIHPATVASWNAIVDGTVGR